MNGLHRRAFLRAGVLALGAAHLGACSGDKDTPAGDAKGLTLRFPGTDTAFPSPFSYGGGVGYIQLSYLYDTLLWKDGSGKSVPWLAASHQRSPDGRRYTFVLRPGVTWHDGKPLTAEDVAFTYQYLKQHRGQLAPSVITVPDFTTIDSVTAVDAGTVEFRLRQPNWTFEEFTGAGAVPILPRHIWSGIQQPGRQSDPKLLVGSGPYRLESFEPGSGTRLYTAWDQYFVGRPVVRRIEYRPVDDALAALQAGDIDQAGGVGPGTGLRPQAVAPFQRSDQFKVIDAPFGDTVIGLYWNLSAKGPLADPRLRRACTLAIDRPQLVSRLFGGKAAPGNPGLLPPANPYHVKVDDYAHDPAAAKALIAQAGWTAADLDFELLVSQAQQRGPVDLVVADLKAVGIKCTVKTVDLPTFHQRVTKGDTQMWITTFGGTNTDEQPDGLAKVFGSASRSIQRAYGYANPRFDALAAKQRASLDRAERSWLAAEMQRIVAKDLPMLPLLYPPLTTIVRTRAFDAWSLTPGGVAGLVPHVNNKYAFVTGRTSGGVR